MYRGNWIKRQRRGTDESCSAWSPKWSNRRLRKYPDHHRACALEFSLSLPLIFHSHAMPNYRRYFPNVSQWENYFWAKTMSQTTKEVWYHCLATKKMFFKGRPTSFGVDQHVDWVSFWTHYCLFKVYNYVLARINHFLYPYKVKSKAYHIKQFHQSATCIH